MAAAEPGIVAGDNPCCLYCHASGDTLHTFLPCGHTICAACRQGATPSIVRVISPHSLTPQPSAANNDHKSEVEQCVFCSSAVRSCKEPSITLNLLRCVVCGGVCQMASEGVCGHCMCEPCAQHVCRTTARCPACQQPLQPDDIDPSRVVRRRVSDLVYGCKYGVYGCEESGKVEGLILHESECENGERVCRDCGRCVRRNAWDNHLGVCVAVHIECPHQCAVRLPRCEMEGHASQCDYAVVVCDLPACDHPTQRRYLAHHQSDIAYHLHRLAHSFQHNLQIQQQTHVQDFSQHQQLIQQLQEANQQLRTQLQQQETLIQQQQQSMVQQQQAFQQQLQQQQAVIEQQEKDFQQQLQQSMQQQQQQFRAELQQLQQFRAEHQQLQQQLETAPQEHKLEIPSQPVLTITKDDDNEVCLSWAKVETDLAPVTDYLLEVMGPDAKEFEPINPQPAMVCTNGTYTVSLRNLDRNTFWEYRVTARNPRGASPPSLTVGLVPPATFDHQVISPGLTLTDNRTTVVSPSISGHYGFALGSKHLSFCRGVQSFTFRITNHTSFILVGVSHHHQFQDVSPHDVGVWGLTTKYVYKNGQNTGGGGFPAGGNWQLTMTVDLDAGEIRYVALQPEVNSTLTLDGWDRRTPLVPHCYIYNNPNCQISMSRLEK